MFRFVIFDFDGTVVDTGEGIIRSLQYSFEQMGREVPDMSDLKKFIGPPIHYSFTHYYNVSEAEVGEYIKKYRERYTVKGIYECELYKGIVELIDSLKARRIKVGIASSKPLRLIYNVADHLGITEKFDAVVGVRMDDSNHSTKTGLILEAMELMGARDKNEVLMVGDRLYDIEGAKGAGVKSCGVLWGYGSQEEFREYEADFTVKEPCEILKLV